MAKEFDPVIICAAHTGAATMKNNNPSTLYMMEEFAEESYKCYKAGATIVHVHARMDDGQAFQLCESLSKAYS
jgi:3-keto-5-aminohexanoate cleavage enzyme